MSDKIVLVGNGGHARSVANALSGHPIRFVSIDEDDSFLLEYAGEKVVIAIGYVGEGSPVQSTRRKVIDLYKGANVLFDHVVAKDASISSGARIGAGSVVLTHAFVDVGAQIGCHAIVNVGANICHDVVLGENVNICPGAYVLGNATLGDNVFIGAGAIVKQGIHISANTVVGMGAVVTTNITEPGVYIGCPARKMA